MGGDETLGIFSKRSWSVRLERTDRVKRARYRRNEAGPKSGRAPRATAPLATTLAGPAPALTPVSFLEH